VLPFLTFVAFSATRSNAPAAKPAIFSTAPKQAAFNAMLTTASHAISPTHAQPVQLISQLALEDHVSHVVSPTAKAASAQTNAVHATLPTLLQEECASFAIFKDAPSVQPTAPAQPAPQETQSITDQYA
jgi:hypothetical protein